MDQILRTLNGLSSYGVIPVLLLFILAVGIAIFIMQLSIKATIRSSLQDLAKFLHPKNEDAANQKPDKNDNPGSDDTLQK